MAGLTATGCFEASINLNPLQGLKPSGSREPIDKRNVSFDQLESLTGIETALLTTPLEY